MAADSQIAASRGSVSQTARRSISDWSRTSINLAPLAVRLGPAVQVFQKATRDQLSDFPRQSRGGVGRAQVEPEGLSRRRMQQVVRSWTALVAAAGAEERRTQTRPSNKR
jgi:hypothetical protein